MASNSQDNAFEHEKEHQQLIYDATGRLINNISRGVMPQLQRLGMSCKQTQSVLESLKVDKGKIESLKTTLARKKMKVAIFGPTSSGKSMVINAMLGKELLACGMGHTTNCFLTMEQTNVDEDDVPQTYDLSSLGRESYFIIRRSSFPLYTTQDYEDRATFHKENVKYALHVPVLQDLSDATAVDSLDVFFNVEVFLARHDHKCPLLSHYLQIVDCPGVSTCRKLGGYVKDFCGDADVHVLVVNTESGITAEDKEHFLKVKERLPNPDIIIGLTQWDRSANERPERKERVRRKHIEAAFELLKSTGTVSNMEQAWERCFFISGKEALDDALGKQVKHDEGQQERKEAFQGFIRKIEEQASVAGKKAKLDINRRVCQDILISCTHNIHTLKAWISQTINDLAVESNKSKEILGKIDTKYGEYWRESKKQRDKALEEFETELMDCMETVIRKMKNTLADKTKQMKASDSDFHGHGVEVVHKWYASIIRSSQRTTRLACDDYSRDLLREYKSCFEEFPHEHPKAFIEALHEEIFQVNNNDKELSKSMVDSLLRGITDKGLIALFATTRKRVDDVDVQNSRSRAESQRMAAGASILFLRVRRWLMSAVDSRLLERFEVERQHGLDEIKQSCKHAVEQFCDITDSYYDNHIANALRLQYHKDSEVRKKKIKDLNDLAELVNDYRQEAEEINRNCGFESSQGYVLLRNLNNPRP